MSVMKSGRTGLSKVVTISMISMMVVTLLFTGCTKKYRVDYCGRKDMFLGARNSYRPGEEVVVYFPYIATDTDYYFYLDDESLNYGYQDGKGIKISFIMPEHDCVLSYETKNSMEYE